MEKRSRSAGIEGAAVAEGGGWMSGCGNVRYWMVDFPVRCHWAGCMVVNGVVGRSGGGGA